MSSFDGNIFDYDEWPEDAGEMPRNCNISQGIEQCPYITVSGTNGYLNCRWETGHHGPHWVVHTVNIGWGKQEEWFHRDEEVDYKDGYVFVRRNKNNVYRNIWDKLEQMIEKIKIEPDRTS